jgi:hypothetical protein
VDNLTLLGELSGNNTDMSGTRVAFRELAETLLNQLGREALKKCLQDLSAKAQVTINILVRNLFERTADIGFLSGDDDVRAFLRDPANQRERLPALRSVLANMSANTRSIPTSSSWIRQGMSWRALTRPSILPPAPIRPSAPPSRPRPPKWRVSGSAISFPGKNGR